MSKALEIDSSRRSLLKYTVAGLLAGFGGRLLPHVSSAYAATEGGAKALVVYYSRSGNTRAVAEAIHAAGVAAIGIGDARALRHADAVIPRIADFDLRTFVSN